MSEARGAPVVGLVPAAGGAQRLGALPCSKEVFPVGWTTSRGRRRPRAVAEHLLEAFRDARVDLAYVLLRKGKWDIPALLGRGLEDGGTTCPHLAYLALDPTASVPETLDAAWPFVRDHRVALGFPDILFEPRDAFSHLLARQEESGADAVLGLFPTTQAEKADMVELGSGSRVRRLVIKEPDRGLVYTWSIAVWGPRFTRYLHDWVAARRADAAAGERYVGDVVQAAIDDGFEVLGVPFPDGSYLDVGTPEDLERAVKAGGSR